MSNNNERTFTEEIQITGEKLVDTIKDVLHEGNVTHIQIKKPDGEIALEFPVNVGIIGLVLAPILAPIGALAVLAADYTVVITRKGDDPKMAEEPAEVTPPPVVDPE